tara:strand:+ start:845 stop:1099 length:255 start_codon:yes stop_codon:yes gene_type:complete
MYTQNEIALKILNMGKDGYKNDAEGFKKLNQANYLIEKHVTEQLRLNNVNHQRELLKQYNDFINMQYQIVGLDDSDISDFADWF